MESLQDIVPAGLLTFSANNTFIVVSGKIQMFLFNSALSSYQ